MWEEILKGRSASRTTQFIPSLKYGILKYVNDNIPEGELIHFPSLARDPALEQIKTLAKEHFHITKGKQTGGIGGYLHHRAEGQIRNKGGIMLLNAGLVDLGGSASSKKYTRNSTMNDYTLNEISKAKDYSKVKPKKISSQMEEDIEEVVADNEFENNPTFSDKIKHILMQGRKDSRPARTQEEMDEFKRRYPDVDKAGDCGCGCD